jgi:hypothetical protein
MTPPRSAFSHFGRQPAEVFFVADPTSCQAAPGAALPAGAGVIDESR